jgi:hypothetical protein
MLDIQKQEDEEYARALELKEGGDQVPATTVATNP